MAPAQRQACASAIRGGLVLTVPSAAPPVSTAGASTARAAAFPDGPARLARCAPAPPIALSHTAYATPTKRAAAASPCIMATTARQATGSRRERATWLAGVTRARSSATRASGALTASERAAYTTARAAATAQHRASARAHRAMKASRVKGHPARPRALRTACVPLRGRANASRVGVARTAAYPSARVTARSAAGA